jgi:cyanophycinase-like exopeptidase
MTSPVRFKALISATLLLSSLCLTISAQSYTSYYTGNSEDVVTTPLGGITLMGGAVENDEAMKWFLERASGGDILVLRASGSDGYNNYLYSELGININSVETIVFNSPDAATNSYILSRIEKAEAIWLAGGNQWNYISWWRNTPVAEKINEAIIERDIVIGGTSAGMAILGEYYFTAENGTITSSSALNNPYSARVTVSTIPFILHPLLNSVITDTHYDNRDRKGRHLVFMARILKDSGIKIARGVACDEYTAICIDPLGQARVFGIYTEQPGYAWFIQPNCLFPDNEPEKIIPGEAITWDLMKQAIKTYRVPGTPDGSNSFNLNTWKEGVGGTWENWYINEGVLRWRSGSPPDCLTVDHHEADDSSLKVYPNPLINGQLIIESDNPFKGAVTITNIKGTIVQKYIFDSEKQRAIQLGFLTSGIYIVGISKPGSSHRFRIIIP